MACNERDAALIWYSDSYKSWANHRPRGDVSRLSNDELWALGDQYNEWAMEEAGIETERLKEEARRAKNAREQCTPKHAPKNLAFSSLDVLLRG